MTYRISYEQIAAPAASGRAQRIESLRTEHEALRRARDLLDSGDHGAIAVHDDAGGVLAGIRLQLKLGVRVTD
jgi:hypothetical protein